MKIALRTQQIIAEEAGVDRDDRSARRLVRDRAAHDRHREGLLRLLRRDRQARRRRSSASRTTSSRWSWPTRPTTCTAARKPASARSSASRSIATTARTRTSSCITSTRRPRTANSTRLAKTKATRDGAAVAAGARGDRARREDRREPHARDDRGGESARDRRRDHQRAAPGVRDVRRDAGLLIAHRVHRDLARAISAVENGDHRLSRRARAVRRVRRSACAASRRADVIGITGPPGAGKSTLVDRLIEGLRAGGETVAVDRRRPVLAVHPRCRARRPRAHAAACRRSAACSSAAWRRARPAAGWLRRRATRCGSPTRPASTS